MCFISLIFFINRLYKSQSPSRTWLMGSSRGRKGLPPQPPVAAPRRSSITPGSPNKDRQPGLPPIPNRSRSLDGLLDSSESHSTLTDPSSKTVQGATTEQQCISRSCDSVLDPPPSVSPPPPPAASPVMEQTDRVLTKTRSLEEHLDDSESSSGDPKRSSQISLSSDTKRKRNFMDRCVNKVRSLIRK